MKHRRLLPLLVGAAALLAPERGAAADTLLLLDGRTVECPRAEKRGDAWVLKFQNGEVLLPAALVKDAFVSGEAGYEPKDDEERALLEKGLVPHEGKWIPKAQRDSLVAKRAAASLKRIEEAKAHREWRNRYKTKTANFEFEYTIPPDIAKNYIDLMEAYYSNFTKQFRISKPKERLKVCFYHDYDTFLEVSGAHYGVLAYYRFVPPRELNFYYDRLRPEETTAIMFHEAQHYLSHLLNLQFNIPHNFGESFAEYYGGSRWDPEKKTMSLGGIQEGRLTEIQTDIQGGEKKRLEPFLRNQLGYDDYTWGWSFVHFMMETPKYAKDFHKFYVSLPSGKGITRVPQGAYTTVSGDTCLATFKKVMGVDDLDALEKEWHSYIDSKLQVQSVYGYEEAAFAALNTGRRLRATRFFEKAVAEGSKNPTVYLRYGEILRWKERDRAEELFRKGLGIDPLFPELYVALGRLLKWKGGDENEAEGKRLIGLAMELAPDDVETMLLVEDAMEKALPDAPAAGPED